MKKLTIALATIAALNVSFSAEAHNDRFQNDHCEVNLNKDITITPEHILIRENDTTLYDIYKDKTVFYKGVELDLTQEQKALVNQYSTSARKLIPEVNAIVIDGLDIASEALTMTFNELGVQTDIESKFTDLKHTLISRYNLEDGTYHFQANGMDVNYVNDEVDRAVEEVMEEIVPSLVGNVLQLIGKAMTEGEGAFEHLEDLDVRVEERIEAQSARLEEKVESFCFSVEHVDELENELSRTSSKLKELDLIKYRHNR